MEKREKRESVSLEGLQDELARGKIYECSLRDKDLIVDGVQAGEDIFIDPRPSIIDTLLHELIHRRHPRLGERAVRRATGKLMGAMTEADRIRWWKAYRKVVKKRRPMDCGEEG